MITHQCWDLNRCILVKGAPAVKSSPIPVTGHTNERQHLFIQHVSPNFLQHDWKFTRYGGNFTLVQGDCYIKLALGLLSFFFVTKA